MADNPPPSKKQKTNSEVDSSKPSNFLDNVTAGRKKVNKICYFAHYVLFIFITNMFIFYRQLHQ